MNRWTIGGAETLAGIAAAVASVARSLITGDETYRRSILKVPRPATD